MQPQILTKTAAANLSPSERNALRALTTQQTILDYPYYSSVCFRAPIEAQTTTSNQIYTFHRGKSAGPSPTAAARAGSKRASPTRSMGS